MKGVLGDNVSPSSMGFAGQATPKVLKQEVNILSIGSLATISPWPLLKELLKGTHQATMKWL